MPSTNWDPETLSALAAAVEVDVTPFAADRSPRARRTIWSIGVGNELYVRSWKGPTAVWYRDAVASHQGSLEVTGGGASQLVTFEEVDAAAPIQEQISATYLNKYARFDEAAAMNEQGPLESTLRVIPRN
jgi:hypothetical protein